MPEYFDFKPAQKSWGENMRVNILLLNLFNVQARQVLMESRLPNSVLSKVILNLMSSLFTLHYIACTRFLCTLYSMELLMNVDDLGLVSC